MGGGGGPRLPDKDQWTSIFADAIEQAINAEIDPSLFGPEGSGRVVETLTAARAALETLFPKDTGRVGFDIRTKTLPDGTTRAWVHVVYA